jgi:hypothetical protein
MRMPLLALLMFCVPQISAAQTRTFDYGELTIELPAGYEVQQTEPYERSAGSDILEPILLLGPEARDEPLSDWGRQFDSSPPYLRLTALTLTPPDDGHTTGQLSQRVFNGFRSRWGQFAFYVFDEERQLGHMVNMAGAFIALHVARCGDRLIVVEALDYAQMRKLEGEIDRSFLDLPERQRWQMARAGANAEDAERLIANVCQAPARR